MLDPNFSLSGNCVQRFSSSEGVRGPHSIPRRRQVTNQFHRIYSPKAGSRVVLAESQLESDAIILMESRADVVALCEQPMRINGALAKKPYYTFDIGIKCKNGSEEFIEVKPTNKLLESENGEHRPPYWNAIELWCKTHGYKCSVLTENEIHTHKLLIRNWRLLLGFVNRAIECSDKELVQHILTTLRHYPDLCINQLSDHTVQKSDEEITSAVALLIHKHQLSANLDSKMFSRHSPLRVVDAKT